MKDINLYQKVLGVRGLDAIVDVFIQTLTDPQRTFNYFVDWDKIYRNVEKYKIEIGILGSIVGSKNIEKDL